MAASNILSAPGFVDHDLVTGCVYVRLNARTITQTKDFGPRCQVIIDYDIDNNVVGYEVLLPEMSRKTTVSDAEKSARVKMKEMSSQQKKYRDDPDFQEKERKRARERYQRRVREKAALVRSLSKAKGARPDEAEAEE